MTKINLLPWREELRKQQQQVFVIALSLAVVLTCVLFGATYMYIEGMKEYQQKRNTYLDKKIKAVDKKIAKIKEIEDKKSRLELKIELIEGLQKSRPEIVHLFDELRARTPEGIFLTKIKLEGANLIIEGKSDVNAMVSEYMNAIEDSEWLALNQLKIIKRKGSVEEEKYSDFTILAKQVSKKDEEPVTEEEGE